MLAWAKHSLNTSCAPTPPFLPPQKNHLSGLKRRLLRVRTYTVQQLMEVRKEVAPLVAQNAQRAATTSAYTAAGHGQGPVQGLGGGQGGGLAEQDPLAAMLGEGGGRGGGARGSKLQVRGREESGWGRDRAGRARYRPQRR